VPKPIIQMIDLALTNRFAEARKIHLKYYRLFCDLFIDTNPVPVKAAMAMMGLGREVYRLPLCPLTPQLKTQVKDCLKELKLI